MFNKFSYTHGISFVAKKKLTHLSNSQRMVCWHNKVKQPKLNQIDTIKAPRTLLSKTTNRSYS